MVSFKLKGAVSRMRDDLIMKAGIDVGPGPTLGLSALQAARIPDLRSGWNTRIAVATILTGMAVNPIPLGAMDLDLFDGVGEDVLRYVDKAAFLPRAGTADRNAVAMLSQRAGVDAATITPRSAGTGNVVVASDPPPPSLAGYLAVKGRLERTAQRGAGAPIPDVIGAAPLARLPVDFTTAPGLVTPDVPTTKLAPMDRPTADRMGNAKADLVSRATATAPGEMRAKMHSKQAFAVPQISAFSQPQGRLEPLELTQELEVEQKSPAPELGAPETSDRAEFVGVVGPAAIAQIPAGRGISRNLPDGLEAGIVQDRLVARIGGLEAGSVEFIQTDGTISVKLGSLLELVSARVPASELEHLSSSPALDEFLSIEKLQSAGLPIEYDPVYDEFKLGGKSEPSGNQMKSHIDQIGTPQESTSRTNMDQISKGL